MITNKYNSIQWNWTYPTNDPAHQAERGCDIELAYSLNQNSRLFPYRETSVADIACSHSINPNTKRTHTPATSTQNQIPDQATPYAPSLPKRKQLTVNTVWNTWSVDIEKPLWLSSMLNSVEVDFPEPERFYFLISPSAAHANTDQLTFQRNRANLIGEFLWYLRQSGKAWHTEHSLVRWRITRGYCLCEGM